MGDEVIVEGVITIPNDNSNINLFNYRNYLKSKNIYYTVKVDSIEKIEVNKNLFYMIKNKIMDSINKNSSSSYLIHLF